MDQESKTFLRDFLMQCGPSGFEQQSQNFWVNRTKPFTHRLDRDVHGNAIGIINPAAKFKIMLAGHCDEIGFVISHVSKEGCVHIIPLGGIDASILPGTQVKILTRDQGMVDGVIGKKPIHLMEDEDRKKVLPIKDLWVDIGAKDRDDAFQYVSIGDPVAFAPNFLELKNNNFSSKACDDKVGAFVVSEVMKVLHGHKGLSPEIGVYGVSTIQEEVGLRGATTSAFGVDPQVGIAIDVGWASDTPGIDQRVVGEVSLGKGPILHAGPPINHVLGELLIEIAEARKIPYQFTSVGRPGGTDTCAMQATRSGVATALIGVPNRYMHTVVETCNYDDLDNCVKLIVETILAIKPGMSFVPS